MADLGLFVFVFFLFKILDKSVLIVFFCRFCGRNVCKNLFMLFYVCIFVKIHLI